MDNVASNEAISDKKFEHRKCCSHRIFIGPWNLKAPKIQPLQQEGISIDQTEQDNTSLDCSNLSLMNSHEQNISNSVHSFPNTSSNNHASSYNKSPPLNTDNLTGSTSAATSFFTARSKSSDSLYHSVDSKPNLLQQLMDEEENTDEEIDYHLLNSPFMDNRSLTHPTKDTDRSNSFGSDTESLKTIKPTTPIKSPILNQDKDNSKGKLPLNNSNMNSPLSIHTQKPDKNPENIIQGVHKKKSLLWKRNGPIFVSHPIPIIITPEDQAPPPEKPLKRERMLCMRTVTGYNGSKPSRYKTSKKTRYDLLTEKWKQVELTLTSTYITTCSSSSYSWPKKKLENRIYLESNSQQKNLELLLLSPLDYTFCLRYEYSDSREPMTVTFTFKAISFLKCQEWYMQLYDMLPDESKAPRPDWCEVYVPLLDLSVNLPLDQIKNNAVVTMNDVKETVVAVLEEGGDKLAQRLIDYKFIDRKCSIDDFGLCWASKDRVEWIYWTHSSSNPLQRIDWVICPQNIEQTHRLELRLIQHTPNEIILPDIKLKEPPPVEGFLNNVTDFFGSTRGLNTNKKAIYFATFDNYLFYIPANKVTSPNTACFMDEQLQPKNIKCKSFVTSLSPYADTCTFDVGIQEIERRMKLMKEAKGLIDLTEVSYIRRSFTSETVNTTDRNSLDSRTRLINDSNYSTFKDIKKHKNKAVQQPCLELMMENGLQIKFEAYTSETCDLWVNYLAQIIVYWKARKEAERDARSHESFILNSTYYTVPENNRNEITKSTKSNKISGHLCKNQHILADTRIWSYCLYEQCRDVVKSGILYYKPGGRGSYTQKVFILTANGSLLYFDVYNRLYDKKSCNHKKKGMMDIKGCYFYSGADCSKQKRESSKLSSRKVTRIYKNGLSTNDDPIECIFSIWEPKLRRYFSPKTQRIRVYHNDEQLNPNGTTWIFLAPSRKEKEEWIFALNTVSEHLLRYESR